MLKYALDNHGARENDLVLSFFFHGRGGELQKTPLGLFRSLLHQILGGAPDAAPDLVNTFETRCREFGNPGEKWQWHEAELRGFFESSLLNVRENHPVWLFVDALDECGEGNAVELVGVFKSLLGSLASQPAGRGQVRICFSCRHYPIVDVERSMFEICAEDGNANDISTFVDGRLAAFCTRTSSNTLPTLITERASGIFMWARLVVDRILDLERKGFELRKMQAAVRSTPEELNDLYRELVQDMKPASLKLVEWICFAARPLSLDELRWAMIIEADCPYQYESLQAYQNADEYVSDSVRMKRRIQTLSRGLTEVTPTRPVVQFIHQSVKDFFIEEGLLTLGGYKTSTEAAIRAHFKFSKICLRYLSMEEIGQSTSYEGDGFEFLNYATAWWVAHTKQCDDGSVPQNDLLALLGWPSDAFVELWLRVCQEIYRIRGHIDRAFWTKHHQPMRTNLVHVLSKHGVSLLLTTILQNIDEAISCVDANDGLCRTPLSWAAEEGRVAVVKLLLGTDIVNVNARDLLGRTPFWYAVYNRHEVIVKLLLDTGKVDVNVYLKAIGDGTPLLLAAAMGQVSIVKMLLGTGKVNVDAKGRYGCTPLMRAAEMGHTAVVKLLLDTGKVDVDAQNGVGGTASAYAARNGHHDILCLLHG